MKSNLSIQVKKDFEQARAKAFINKIINFIKNKENALLSFDKVKSVLMPYNESYRGIEPIPVDKIIGSEDRYRDFDREFFPLQDHTRNRWESIDSTYYTQKELPPIQVYKIGDYYFVKDGNHRVSVARKQGRKFIDAEIIELKTKIPLDEKKIDYKTIIIKEELKNFLERTGLDNITSPEEFKVTSPGEYEILINQIKTHHYILNLLSQEEISWYESAKSWYNVVYKPIIQLIKDSGIMKKFKNKTPTDLFIWFIRRWKNIKNAFSV